jgi:hypothetical protein
MSGWKAPVSADELGARDGLGADAITVGAVLPLKGDVVISDGENKPPR